MLKLVGTATLNAEPPSPTTLNDAAETPTALVATVPVTLRVPAASTETVAVPPAGFTIVPKPRSVTFEVAIGWMMVAVPDAVAVSEFCA